MGINLVIAVTDGDWFDMLRQQPNLAEVNFWAPSPANFRVLRSSSAATRPGGGATWPDRGKLSGQTRSRPTNGAGNSLVHSGVQQSEDRVGHIASCPFDRSARPASQPGHRRLVTGLGIGMGRLVSILDG